MADEAETNVQEADAAPKPASEAVAEPPAEQPGEEVAEKPPEAPPVDAPPADVLPADAPPADVPPTDVPPVDEPPTDKPPADEPPAEGPPADEEKVHVDVKLDDVSPADDDLPPADASPKEPSICAGSEQDQLEEEKVVSGDYLQFEKKYADIVNRLKQIKLDMDKNISMVEEIDLSLNAVTFKIYKTQNTFRSEMDTIKKDKETALINLSPSELSLELVVIEARIEKCQNVLADEMYYLNKQKRELQEQHENKIYTLDLHYDIMKTNLNELQNELDKIDTSQSIFLFLIGKYLPILEEYKKHFSFFGKIQLTGWKSVNSEIRISDVLQERGMKITKSGYILTKSGTRLTYDQAQEKGLFDGLDIPFQKIFQYLQKIETDDEAEDKDHTEDEVSSSSESTTSYKITSEDVAYLKEKLGKALTLALAEITLKQPRDPIHYLSHWLFKFRYNQQRKTIDDNDLDKLNTERERRYKERYRKFVEDEAKAILMEILDRVDQTVLAHELMALGMSEGEDENEDEFYEMPNL